MASLWPAGVLDRARLRPCPRTLRSAPLSRDPPSPSTVTRGKAAGRWHSSLLKLPRAVFSRVLVSGRDWSLVLVSADCRSDVVAMIVVSSSDPVNQLTACSPVTCDMVSAPRRRQDETPGGGG